MRLCSPFTFVNHQRRVLVVKVGLRLPLQPNVEGMAFGNLCPQSSTHIWPIYLSIACLELLSRDMRTDSRKAHSGFIVTFNRSFSGVLE